MNTCGTCGKREALEYFEGAVVVGKCAVCTVAPEVRALAAAYRDLVEKWEGCEMAHNNETAIRQLAANDPTGWLPMSLDEMGPEIDG